MSVVVRFIALTLMVALVPLAGCGEDDPAAPPPARTPVIVIVDLVAGNDTTGTGSAAAPYQTITKGLSVARHGDTVRVRPGNYGYNSSESMPITVPDGVILEGTDWEQCVIVADPNTHSGLRQAVSMNCTDCGIRKFSFLYPGTGTPAMSSWVDLDGCNNALVDSLHCRQRTTGAQLMIEDDNGSVIRNCRFEDLTPFSWEKRGVYFWFGRDTTLRDLYVGGFNEGITIAGTQNVLVEDCVITNNLNGVVLASDLYVADETNPDFGGGALGSHGGNNFAYNLITGIRNSTRHTIYARFNTWTTDPPVEGADYVNSSGGTVVTE